MLPRYLLENGGKRINLDYLRYLLENGGKRINLDYFPTLRRGHTRIANCCDGSKHVWSRLDAAKEWAEERGLKIIVTPNEEVVAI